MHQSQERHYNILKLNKWFAISSVIFTFIWLIAFADDFNRQWKPYQKTFRSIEIEQIRKDLDAADKNLTASEEFSLMSDKLEDAEEALAANKDKLIAIQEGIDTLDAERYRRNQIYQFSEKKVIFVADNEFLENFLIYIDNIFFYLLILL